MVSSGRDSREEHSRGARMLNRKQTAMTRQERVKTKKGPLRQRSQPEGVQTVGGRGESAYHGRNRKLKDVKRKNPEARKGTTSCIIRADEGDFGDPDEKNASKKEYVQDLICQGNRENSRPHGFEKPLIRARSFKKKKTMPQKKRTSGGKGMEKQHPHEGRPIIKYTCGKKKTRWGIST